MNVNINPRPQTQGIQIVHKRRALWEDRSASVEACFKFMTQFQHFSQELWFITLKNLPVVEDVWCSDITTQNIWTLDWFLIKMWMKTSQEGTHGSPPLSMSHQLFHLTPFLRLWPNLSAKPSDSRLFSFFKNSSVPKPDQTPCESLTKQTSDGKFGVSGGIRKESGIRALVRQCAEGK